MTEEKTAPSFIEQFRDNFLNGSEASYLGDDSNGRYESIASLPHESDADYIIETRRYFYPDGRLRRMARILNEAHGESLLRTEEWSEDGSRRHITSYGDEDEWLWEKTTDLKAGYEKLAINHDCFVFFSISEDLIRSLEAGEFQPEWLLEIRWEDAREAILEILGAARAVSGLPMQTVDQWGPNRLIKMEWRDRWGEPRMEPWCFLELHCTTSGKISYLRVPPGFSDIMSAVAWTFGMDKKNYRLEEET
jgi:hypothetical protein